MYYRILSYVSATALYCTVLLFEFVCCKLTLQLALLDTFLQQPTHPTLFQEPIHVYILHTYFKQYMHTHFLPYSHPSSK